MAHTDALLDIIVTKEMDEALMRALSLVHADRKQVETGLEPVKGEIACAPGLSLPMQIRQDVVLHRPKLSVWCRNTIRLFFWGVDWTPDRKGKDTHHKRLNVSMIVSKTMQWTFVLQMWCKYF